MSQPLVIDLDDCYERQPDVHRVKAFCEAAGAPFRYPRWWHSPEGQRQARELVPRLDETIAFHVQACWRERVWPIGRFQVVAEALASTHAIVQLGGPGDAELGLGRDLRGRPWDVVAACLARCRLLVGVDSVLHHLAAAVGTECVVVFGCCRPDVMENPMLHPVWNADLECAGCLQAAPAPARSVKCRKSVVECLESISVDLVIEKVNEVLKHDHR